MQTVNRRVFLGGIAALPIVGSAHAGTMEELSVNAEEGSMSLTRYATDHLGKRPCVLVLHGSRGIEIKPRIYERYANALTASGIDAYFLRYYTAADSQALDPKTSTKESREAYDSSRFDGWSRRVSSVMTAILARSDNSGRVGLLGFSLGGYVAAATAAHDERVAALAVMYGGMPDDMVLKVKRLPPLIELHGESDSNVPLAKGEELVKLGKALGAKAELVTYPGKEHGFDFADTDPMTSDAVGRVALFFQSQLA